MKYTTNLFLQDNFLLYGKLSLTAHIIKYSYFKKIKKTLTSILPQIPYLSLILFLGFFAVSVLALHLEKGSGLRVANIKTGSMLPTIPAATIIITKPQKNYFVGDIVTYREVNTNTGLSPSRTFTHRIIEKQKENTEDIFITKGDSNKFPDPHPVKHEYILGKVIIKIPYLGYVDFLLKTKTGFTLLILLPTAYLISKEFNFIRNVLTN